jgi:hypothetical protein
MVEHLYAELRGSLEYVVKERMPALPPNQSVRELIAGRDWLFEGGNYHIDVSHLNAVVRFARSLGTRETSSSPEAIELAEYGSKLDPQLQYRGDPPFTDFYTAHLHYLKVLSGRRRSRLRVFRPRTRKRTRLAGQTTDRLRNGRSDDPDRPAGSGGRIGETVSGLIEDPNGFSFADLCCRAGKMDVLVEAALNNNDPLRFTAGLIGELQTATPA